MLATAPREARATRRWLLSAASVPALAFSSGALAACRRAEQPAQVSQPALDKPTGPISIGSRGGTDMQASADLFTERTGIKTTVEALGNEPDYWLKSLLLHNTGTLTDVLWASTGGHRLLAAKGALANLSPIISAARCDMTDFTKSGLDSMSHEGKLFGLPWGGHPGDGGLLYNADLLQQNGFPRVTDDAATTLDWTYDTLKEAARRTFIQDQRVGYRPGVNFLDLNNVVGAYGGEFFDREGRRLTIDTPQFMAGMEWVASIWQEGLAGPWSGYNAIQEFGAGRLTAFHSGYWGQRDGMVLEGAAKWNCTVQPLGPAGKRGTSLTINGMCLWGGSKQLSAGWEFLKFLFEPDVHLPDVLSGRSRPALKRSILYHPRLLEGMKAQKVWADAISAAEPWKMPANYRWAEFDTVVREVFLPVWQGTRGLREVMGDARTQLQRVLDQPVPE
jgi:ABC-type glycerol-3-phosphate transport system substrate-binding protein